MTDKSNSYQWRWDPSTSTWVEVPINCPTKRMTATGQVIAAAARLQWISMNPSGPDAEFAISDDTTGLTATVYDHFHSGRDAHHVRIEPTMKFDNGIYLKTLNRMTSIIFGYTLV